MRFGYRRACKDPSHLPQRRRSIAVRAGVAVVALVLLVAGIRPIAHKAICIYRFRVGRVYHEPAPIDVRTVSDARKFVEDITGGCATMEFGPNFRDDDLYEFTHWPLFVSSKRRIVVTKVATSGEEDPGS